MLVCAECGTQVAVAGHKCPACGHRGAIDSRFYHGELKPTTATAAKPADLATHDATASGLLPDAQRAWSPWLAGLVAVPLGPAAGTLVAVRNLKRLGRLSADPWSLVGAALAGQLLLGAVAGYLARSHASAAWAVLGLVNLLVLIGLVYWQAEPVSTHRAAHPGRHVPGADAFGAFVLALLLGLAGGYAEFRLGERTSQGQLSGPLHEAFPSKPESAPPMREMPMMPPR